MDLLVEKVQVLSQTETGLKQLKSELTNYEQAFLNFSDLETLLHTFDPRVHSLAWIFILSARARQSNLEYEGFVSNIQRFAAEGASNQIQLVPDRFSKVMQRFVDLTIEKNQPMRAIKAVQSAIKKLQPNPNFLTPLHSELIKLCVYSKCYQFGIKTVEEDILEVDPQLNPKDFLAYFYYSGLLCIGLKNYKRALELLQISLTVPASAYSAIMVEAYKKYVLVSLLVHGNVEGFPKYTSPLVLKLKNFLSQYTEFATAYSTNSTEDLHKCAQSHIELFQRDKNFGLIKQCIQSQDRRNIQRLTQTYVTLSLTDIAKSAKLSNPKDAEQSLLRMIESNEISATISEKDGMVSFKEDTRKYDTETSYECLDQAINRVTSLVSTIHKLEEQVSLSQGYIQRLLMNERHGNIGLGGRMDQEDMMMGGGDQNFSDKSSSLRG